MGPSKKKKLEEQRDIGIHLHAVFTADCESCGLSQDVLAEDDIEAAEELYEDGWRGDCFKDELLCKHCVEKRR